MDELEKDLQGLFGQEAKKQLGRKGCLSELQIHQYLERQMNPANRQKVEQHLVECYDCLEKVAEVSKAKSQFEKGQIPKPPHDSSRWLKRLRPQLSLRKGATSRSRRRPWGWLAVTVCAFTCSFIFPRYFAQFLVATLLFGIKWIVETRTTKTLIAIQEAYKRGDRQTAADLLEKLGKR